MPYLVCAHYCYLMRAAHMSIDMGVWAHEVTSSVERHLSSLLWGAASWGHSLGIVFVRKGRGWVVLGGMIVGVCIVGSSCCERNGIVSYLGCRKGSAGSGTYIFKMKTKFTQPLNQLQPIPVPIFNHHILMSRTLNQKLTQICF